MRRTGKKITSLRWPELDKIELTAAWVDADRFRVKRRHGDVDRGAWEFERKGRNDWECVQGGPLYLRGRWRTPNPDPRKTDESRIPHDVQLKAKQFLSDETKVRPKIDSSEISN
jgi:hypothetical protein